MDKPLKIGGKVIYPHAISNVEFTTGGDYILFTMMNGKQIKIEGKDVEAVKEYYSKSENVTQF